MSIPYEDVDRTIAQLKHAIDFADITQPDGTGTGSVAINGTATGERAIAINGSASASNTVAIKGQANDGSTIAIGGTADGTQSISIGGVTNGEKAVVLGKGALAGASNAIQLGSGTNNVANTFKVFDTTILNANGKIPASVIEGGGGGGTSDYSQLTNKPSINSVELNGNKSLADLGIQPSGDYATATALNNGLATKQNAFTVGKGLTLANSVLSADTNKQLFVGSLPTENIVEKAIYYTPNYALFAGVANYVTTEHPTVVVTRQNDLPSKMLQMACNTNKNYGATAPKSYIYNIYDYVDGGWVLNQSSSVSVANNEWASKMGFPTNVTGSAATVRAQFESLIWYSSQDFSYERSYWGYKTVKSSDTPPTWRGNVTDANGIPLDTSSINYCLFNTYQYVNGAWVNYGVSDFSELFAHFIDVLNSKADSATTYTKTEVDTAINETIGDAMIQILGGSV